MNGKGLMEFDGSDEELALEPVAPAATDVVLLAAPSAGFQGAVAAGEMKASMAPDNIFILGILAGAQIGFGAYLMLSVGAACPGLLETNPGLHQIVLGAFGLPFGLLMVVMSGTELSTGNYAVVTMALLEGRATKAELIKNWSLSFLGNLVGSLGFVLLVYFGNTLGASPAAGKIAVVKTSLPFGVAFVRGIMCNWLVCMAVYLASFAKDAIGKLVPIWFCISAFIALGLEHSARTCSSCRSASSPAPRSPGRPSSSRTCCR